MSNCLLALAFLFVCAKSVHCQVRYYITPSLNDSCPQDPCTTLSEFAANSNGYYRNETSLALSFLPGHHSLDRDLSLSHADNFSVTKDVGENENETVIVECVNKLGRFNISNANFVSVSGVNFIGCGGNEVTQVEHFIIEDATFQCVEAECTISTLLVINEVKNASIERSVFLSNISSISGQHPKLNSNQAKLDYLYLKRNPLLAVGGAVYVAFSNILIVKSKFEHNTAEIGGTLVAYNSSLHIDGSTFAYNRASFGGVMVTSESSVIIANSTFNNNTAIAFGGVMVAYKDSFTISSTIFINNSAAIESGVIEAFNSSFHIVYSSFNDNAAKESGGVMFLVGGSFNISSCNFTSNRAYYNGGVLRTHGKCTLNITSAQFINNSAGDVGGVIYASGKSTFSITGCTFTNNSVKDGSNGGVMATYRGESLFIIANSTFTKNSAMHAGGVMCIFDTSSCSVTNSHFTHNSAGEGGVFFTLFKSSFNISNSTFTKNRAVDSGGVIMTHLDESSFTITHSIFSENNAADGGVLYTFEAYASFIVISSAFTNNSATGNGGVLLTSHTSFNITDSTFTSNTASGDGGVIATFTGESSLNIIGCIFSNNSAKLDGGVVGTLYSESSFNIVNSTFEYNTATRGGVMDVDDESAFSITRSIFTDNIATNYGGVIHCLQGSFDINDSGFHINQAKNYGGIMFNVECSTHIANSTFQRNLGSFYTFNSNLTFSGQTRFEDCGRPLTTKMAADNQGARILQEGGAITSFKSTVVFAGDSNLSNNQASRGGAILATESTIVMYGRITIANNTATQNSGGGVSLHQSELEIRGYCTISHNLAVRGGGIHATSSTIAVYQPGTLQIINNRAENGSGIYLEVNPKLYILKKYNILSRTQKLLIFNGNHANYGGAVYVADGTNSGACSIDTECFIQTFVLDHDGETKRDKLTNSVIFSGNTATKRGDTLFGGLMDRCVASSFAEVSLISDTLHSGVAYLETISNITQNSISSPPVRLCFCNSKKEPDCSYQPTPIKVKKGEPFSVSVVAVDQVNHTVTASIICSLSSLDGGFSEGQQTQRVGRNCTDLNFNVISPHDAERISLFADGPCGSSEPSTQHLDVYFTDCTCPAGFEPSSSELTRCICTCDSKLIPYITNCNSTTKSLLRINTISWITYINDTDPAGYVIHPNCPYDYCESPTRSVNINFNSPNGADSQCAHNRTGFLCGACQEHLSLSLGSSRCLPCERYWPAVFIVILLAAFVVGFLLVTVLLALNITVAIGLMNGFILYANIVGANSTVFFPPSENINFPMIFVAWLNLDIGIDVCFVDGLDMYTKTWLQLAFPLYIISIVVIVIKVSQYSPRFTRLIGRRDPVATLATLILLSYAKLLSIIITALSFAVLEYPDGSREIVWLPDSNVKYFQGKHIALTFIAVFIILIGVPYTALLFLWQWLVRIPESKVFKWTSKTKLNAFIIAYHIPYNSKYRYWTGVLLFVRVILYVTASVTASANPQIFLLVIIILVVGLLLFKGIIGSRVYKKSIVDIFETVMFFNLIALTAFSLYDFKTDVTKQTVIAYISTTITFILLIAAIIYHLTLLIRKHKAPQEKEYPLIAHLPPKAEVTHSFVEIPKLHDQCLPQEANSDETENISRK